MSNETSDNEEFWEESKQERIQTLKFREYLLYFVAGMVFMIAIILLLKGTWHE